MKINNKSSVKEIVFAFFIFMISGWRMISVFGYPPRFDKHKMDSYLFACGDGTIIDHCQYHGRKKGKTHGVQAGIGMALYPDYLELRMWKSIKKTKKWAYFACNHKQFAKL